MRRRPYRKNRPSSSQPEQPLELLSASTKRRIAAFATVALLIIWSALLLFWPQAATGVSFLIAVLLILLFGVVNQVSRDEMQRIKLLESVINIVLGDDAPSFSMRLQTVPRRKLANSVASVLKFLIALTAFLAFVISVSSVQLNRSQPPISQPIQVHSPLIAATPTATFQQVPLPTTVPLTLTITLTPLLPTSTSMTNSVAGLSSPVNTQPSPAFTATSTIRVSPTSTLAVATQTPQVSPTSIYNQVIEILTPRVAIMEIENAGKKGEAVLLANFSHDIDLDGWSLADDFGNSFQFRDTKLMEGSILRLHTGRGDSTARDIYWNLNAPIWAKSLPTLTLSDEVGAPVDVLRVQ
ncbi:MAG: lamin tail domain-containing protein [Caldilinea sp.]|nr:lamin tail domain-containing protein [Caldilinea sp.]